MSSSGDEAPNLYQILGASPKDSDAELKRKWQRLARQLHPDANIPPKISGAQKEGQGMVQEAQSPSFSHPYDLSDVNAAWGVLSDPKERRRYDRALQAQELADTFEILLDAGIKSAIPWFKKTADGAVKLGEETGKTWKGVSEKSNKVMLDVNKKMRINAQIYDLETEGRELEKRASNARLRIQRLRKQLEMQSERKLQSLQNSNSQLTSQDAIRILNRFGAQTPPPTSNGAYLPQSQSMLAGGGGGGVFADADIEIEFLQDLEFQYQDQNKYHQNTLSNLKTAERQAADAIAEEERAIRRLEQAQRDLADAQARNHACQKAQFEAVQIEKDALLDANAAASRLNQQTEKVRYVLKQKESETMAREARNIQQEMAQLEMDEIDFQQQAATLKQQASQLRRQKQQDESR